MELKEAIEKLKEIKKNCRYKTYVPNEQRDEWKQESQAIDIVLKELNKKDKVIDLMYQDIESEYLGTSYMEYYSLENYYRRAEEEDE